jgi:hypothetical protein
MNALQSYILARVARQEAEAVEKSHRAEVFAALEQAGLPQVVEVSGRSFLFRIGAEAGKKFITMLEVAPSSPAPNKQPDPAPSQSSPTAKPTASEASAPKEAAAKQSKTESSAAPNRAQKSGPVSVTAACSAEFAKACSSAAQDEGWNRHQWADSVIPEAYLSWVEGEQIAEDPGIGESQIALLLSRDVADMVADFAKFLGGRATGAALRRLLYWTLRKGGYIGGRG